MERIRDPDLVSRFCEQEEGKRAPKLGQVTDREGEQEKKEEGDTKLSQVCLSLKQAQIREARA